MVVDWFCGPVVVVAVMVVTIVMMMMRSMGRIIRIHRLEMSTGQLTYLNPESAA